MDLTGTSREVLDNPSLYENCIIAAMNLTEGKLLVWRKSKHNPNKFEAFPSDKIKTEQDFENQIGKKFTGITVGHPADARKIDKYLWLRITDGCGQQYYIEYRDAPTDELKILVKKIYDLASSKCNKGSITSLPLYG